MLARIEAHETIHTAFLSSDGRRLLLRGAPGAERAELFAACAHVLSKAKLRPTPRPDAEARAAWADRDDRSAWLGRGGLWRLSWREAETFADRLVAELVQRFGPKIRELRGTLVESFFEAVRPRDGSGPTANHWPRGTSYQNQVEILLAEAAWLVEVDQVAELEALLRDPKAVRKITRPPPEENAMTARETPWSLSFHDGSGNGTRVWQDEPGEARFEYTPVTPAQSSSGTYSGGEPGQGAVTTASVDAIWQEAERLAADPALHVKGRAMGTGRLRLKTPAEERTLVIQRGSFDELDALLRRIRGE